MNTEYYNLVDGSMEINESNIIITDTIKRYKLNFILSVISFIILGLVLLFKGIFKKDYYLISIGSLLAIVWILRFIKEERDLKNTMSEIYLSNIASINYSEDKKQGSLLIYLNLKTGGYRKIKLVTESDQEKRIKQVFTALKPEMHNYRS